MFDFIFQGASAYDQVMLIVMALVFMGVGGFLLGYEINWHLRALRVMGTIVGVRETKPNMYRNVYQYSLPGSSEILEATSNTGSNSARGRETGRRVELLVFADRPEQVSEARTVVAAVFGAVFFLIGLWPLHKALTERSVTGLTWLMLGGVVALIAYRGRAFIIPKGDRKSRSEWQSKRRDELAAAPIRRIEDVLASPEAAQRRERDEKQSRLVRPLLLVTGVAAVAFAVHLGQGLVRLERAGLRTAGTVIALQADSASDGPSYRPVVRFIARDGVSVEFKDRVGSNPAPYQVGEKVTVLYANANPANSATIDRGSWNWLPPVGLGVFGLFFVFVSLRLSSERG